MTHAQLKAMPPIDVIGAINTGEQIIGATLPFIEEIIAKIQAAGHSDNINTPHGKKVHIEALEALSKVETEKFKLYDKYFAQLIEKQIITE